MALPTSLVELFSVIDIFAVKKAARDSVRSSDRPCLVRFRIVEFEPYATPVADSFESDQGR